jgi:biopolymer transport protein ExbD
MNKLRPSRFKNLWVDMTAMCDVACLLLCFFIVTPQYEQWEPLKINVPVSKIQRRTLPGENIAFIYVSGDKVMFQVVGVQIIDAALTEMCRYMMFHLHRQSANNF